VRGNGDINEAQRVLATFPAENKILLTSDFGDVPNVMGNRAYVSVLAREFTAALRSWESAGSAAIEQRRQLSARGASRVLHGAGRSGAARPHRVCLLAGPAAQIESLAPLKIDPVCAPIRHDAGFQQRLTVKEHTGP